MEVKYGEHTFVLMPMTKEHSASIHMCVKRVNELNSTQGDGPSYLYKSGRCALAHAFSDPVVDPGDVADLHRLVGEDTYLAGLPQSSPVEASPSTTPPQNPVRIK